MRERNYARLLSELTQSYLRHSPQSAAVNEEALQNQVDGGSHALRLVQPFPPRITTARGAWLTDEDGHDILDFWQGHLANILGHNPDIVTKTLAQAFEDGFGLQTGFTDRLQAETAELLCQRTGGERVRFTTSGSLATMYAMMLSRAWKGRNLIMKVGGGWHGSQPWALKGVDYDAKNAIGYQKVETEGLPPALSQEVIVTGFNDPDLLHDHFRRYGDRLACFIVEPFIGVGGFLPATPEYLQTARALTNRHGVALIFDEVISGFRFRAGDTGALYGIQPDLAVFGKIIGGGMPVAAVVGRAELMNLAGRAGGNKVKFSGGTYSAHPSSLLAAKTLMEYLVTHEDPVYDRLAELGDQVRRTVKEAFLEEGIYADCTGHGNQLLRGSSMVMLHFPYQENFSLDRPEIVSNPTVCDVTLTHKVVDLALLLENVFMLHSHGAVSTAHTATDLEYLGEACRRVARRIKPFL